MTASGRYRILRCLECRADRELDMKLTDQGESLLCTACGAEYPVIEGTARMLRSPLREMLGSHGRRRATEPTLRAKQRTAESFGFEWQHFSTVRPEWEKNFLTYMRPHGHEFFKGKLVLDVGSGSGRHAYHAARDGAQVVAVDLGPAIDITRRNTARYPDLLTVQADLYDLPFAPGSFDFVYSVGVLHHLPDPEAGFRRLVALVRPGGEINIYVYWRFGSRPKRLLLALVNTVRRVTIRLPLRVVYWLSFPIAALGFLLFVWPSKLLRQIHRFRSLARSIPLSAYADYPFIVCVNDQFDRFSAPIEKRYLRHEVQAWLEAAGLEDSHIDADHGWIAGGRRPIGADR